MKLQNLEGFYRWHSKVYEITRSIFLAGRTEAVDLLALQDGDRVIDWGCGTGLNFPLLLRKKVDLVGIDDSASMLGRAREKFPEIELVQGDMSHYPFPEQADKAICTYSLSMVDPWKETIRNICRALKPTGRLVILDFGQLTGPLKLLAPFFSAWLKLHGVNPGMSLSSLLPKYFHGVKIRSLHRGYSFLALAEFPVLQPSPTRPPDRPFRVVSHRFIFPPGGSRPILSFDFTLNR